MFWLAAGILVLLVGWAIWQIGWRGGQKKYGRDGIGAAGDSVPMW